MLNPNAVPAVGENLMEDRATNFLGVLSEAKLKKIAAAAEKVGAAKAEFTVTKGLLFKREHTVKAADLSAADLVGVSDVSIKLNKSGISGFFASDPTVAEGHVDRGVARVRRKSPQLKDSSIISKAPSAQKTFNPDVLREEAPAIREAFATQNVHAIRVISNPDIPVVSAENTTGVSSADATNVSAVSATNAPGLSAENLSSGVWAIVSQLKGEVPKASFFRGVAEQVTLVADNDGAPVNGASATAVFYGLHDIDMHAKPDFMAAAASDDGVKASGRAFAGAGQIGAAPVSRFDGINRRGTASAAAIMAYLAEHAGYKGIEGGVAETAQFNAPVLATA